MTIKYTRLDNEGTTEKYWKRTTQSLAERTTPGMTPATKRPRYDTTQRDNFHRLHDTQAATTTCPAPPAASATAQSVCAGWPTCRSNVVARCLSMHSPASRCQLDLTTRYGRSPRPWSPTTLSININTSPASQSNTDHQLISLYLGGSVVEWLGRPTHDSRVRLPVTTLPAWLFISETGDRLWRVNCLGKCSHHLGQLSLASLRGR